MEWYTTHRQHEGDSGFDAKKPQRERDASMQESISIHVLGKQNYFLV